jgi:epsin
MPLIYKRFTDKTAEEWRQIYKVLHYGQVTCIACANNRKSLQLLEFLVKNGSERVIDDARQHVSLLRMLRQFHFIDQNGKDQGVNVRNRAQELAKLLSDVDAIRAERKKARANRNKYGGVEGGIGGGMSSGSRYGGFGSEEAGYGGYRGEVYGDGGGYGGNTSGFQDTQRRGDKFEEYDEGEEDGGSPAAKPSAVSRAQATSGLRAASLNTIKRDAKIKKEPEPDLFDFGDEPVVPSTSNGKTKMSSPEVAGGFTALESGTAGDDDFDDFQSATTPGLTTEAQRTAFSGLTSPPPAISTIASSTPFVAPQPVAPLPASNINDLFASISPTASSTKSAGTPTPSISMTSSISSPPTSQANKPSTAAFSSTGPNYYTSVQSTINNPTTTSAKSPLSGTLSQNQSFSSMGQRQSSSFGSSTTAASLGKPSASTTTPSSGSDAFGSLWSTASGKAGIANKSGAGANKGPDLASMAKAKNEAAMWGTPNPLASGGGGGSRSGSAASIPPRPSAPTPRTASQQPKLGGGLDDLLG